MRKEEKKEKMVFSDYYDQLPAVQKTEVVKEVCKKLAISQATFYNKKRENDYSPAELEAIERMYNIKLTDNETNP
jgi:hypothetical protein